MVTRLYSNARGCPVDPCPRTVRPGHLMCASHWRQVPKDTQAQVWSTWRKWNRTHGDDDWAAYMTARETALDAVNG
jgi:hypothetical protein